MTRWEELLSIYDKYFDRLWGDPRHRPHFVWCLTDDEAAILQGGSSPGDRLSQWRSYSHGGHGYSLGFDADLLLNSLSRIPESVDMIVDFGPCEYGTTTCEATLSSIALNHLDHMLRAWETYRNESEEAEAHRERLLTPFILMYVKFLGAASFMKHPGFREEREWRFVFVTANVGAREFRESQFGLTPYIALNLELASDQSPLREITVGPTAHEEQSIDAVNMLLQKKGIQGVKVKSSNIPYRNW